MNNNISWGECWHDTSLERIVIDYNDIVVEIDIEEKTTKLICCNFIGIEYLGQWDENIIKSITISEDNALIYNTKKKIKFFNNDGGGVKKYDTDWKCVSIELIDGVIISIVCEKVKCDWSPSKK